MKVYRFITAAVLLAACFSAAQAQKACGDWTINITAFEENGEPVRNIAVEFVNVPAGDNAFLKEFVPVDGDESTFFARFAEGSPVSEKYELRISAVGFYERTVTVPNRYCVSTANEVVLKPNGLERPPDRRSAVLSGRGTDGQGRRARVVFINQQDPRLPVYSVRTDREGFYSIRLKPGVYQITRMRQYGETCEDYASEFFRVGGEDIVRNFVLKCPE